jgi:hypothetical protein
MTCLTAPGVGALLEWNVYLGASLLQTTTSDRVYISYDAPAVTNATTDAASAVLLRTTGGNLVVLTGMWAAVGGSVLGVVCGPPFAALRIPCQLCVQAPIWVPPACSLPCSLVACR